MLVYRSLGPAALLAAASRAALLTAKIMVVVAAAGAISWLLTVQGVPQAASAWVAEAGFGPLGFLLAVNLMLLVVGCFLDPTSSILVLAPLLTPIAVSLGIDPIHFGVVMTVNLAIGMFTPPFGLNIFVAQSVTGVPAATIYRGVLPYMGVQLVALALITAFPAIALTLVGTMT
jgi:C4-dicarboxylate transporter DctM subunit